MAAQRVFYFLVYFLIPVVRLQGYFGWTSSDGGHCWSDPGVTCSLQPSGCGPNQVNNPWGVGCSPEGTITLNRPTTQTSPATGQPSNLGVDGDVNTCASTTRLTNPTWYVDLPGLHVVHGVRFKGGVYTGDSCSNTQIAIKVEGIAKGVAVNGTVCAQFSGTASCNGMETINCGSVGNPGNRLVIHHTGTGQLRVCELEIIGYQYPYNLAYGKPVMQDGANANRHAYYAVDGRLGTRILDEVCTQTKHSPGPKPWWWVDLGSPNVVYSVRLLNLDNVDNDNIYRRLKDFTIYVGDKNATAEFSSNAVCHRHGSNFIGAAASVEFLCQNGPLVGRYVIVQLNANVGVDAYLQLCEVMVKGYKEKACPQRYGPDCSRQCDCPDPPVYTCDYITGACCGQYKKGYRCEQDLPKLTNAPIKSSRTDTSIKVKWDAWNTSTGSGSATVVKYEVQYKPRRGSGTTTGTQQATERNVTGLQKDTEYCFSVVVLDENNWRGEPSPESCIKTCGDPTGANLDVTTNLEGSKTKSNIAITWNGLDYNCDSGRFELRVQKGMLSCDQISGTPLNTGSVSSFTVSNKIPYSYYTVKFTAINNAGLHKSNCKSIRTAEGVPPSPSNTVISSASHNSLSVTWSNPNPPHGIIVEYAIQYSLIGSETHLVKKVANVEGDEITSEIPDLLTDKNYTVKVRAFTSVGPGSWSETLYAVTVVGKPEEPEELRNTSKGYTYIILEWNPPRIKNGQITGYEVICEPGNIDEPIFGDKTIFNLTGLTSSTLYSCKVKAATSAGLGKESRSIQVWTKPKIDLQTVKETTNNILSKTKTSITVKLVPIPNVDVYRIIVENGTEHTRSKRDVAGDSSFPETKHQHLTGYHDAKRDGLSYYITAEMTNPPDTFTVGDGKEYGGYLNQALVSGEMYNVYYGGKTTTDGETDEAYFLIIGNEIPESLNVPGEPEEETSNTAVIGGVVGGVALILTIVIVAMVILRRKKLGPFARKDNPSNVNTENNQDLKLTNLSQDPNKEGIYEEIPDPDKNGGESSYTKLSGNTKAPAGESAYTGINSAPSNVYVNDSVVSGVYVNDV